MEQLISVIVPIYKVEAYLPRCLDSIINQTYRNLEIILVDDGSTDCSGSICDSYAQRDARIQVIHQENQGVSAARNTGLEQMHGSYLMFVDSDDWLRPDAVRVLYDRLNSDGSDMAVARHTDAYNDGTQNDAYCRWMKDMRISHAEAIDKMATREFVPVCVWGKLYRREVYEGLRFPDVKHAEDAAIFPLVLDRCKQISISKELLYYYYQHDGSLMHSMCESARRDSLMVNLEITVYLIRKGNMAAAAKWFERCVYQAFQMKDLKKAKELIHSILQKKDRKTLMTRQGMKIKIKWLAIHCPFLGFAPKLVQSMMHGK